MPEEKIAKKKLFADDDDNKIQMIFRRWSEMVGIPTVFLYLSLQPYGKIFSGIFK